MKAQMLKLAKCKDGASFYKKFPTEESFMAKYGKEFKKLQLAKALDGTSRISNVSNNWQASNPKNSGTVNSFDLSNQWNNTLPKGELSQDAGSIPMAQDGRMIGDENGNPLQPMLRRDQISGNPNPNGLLPIQAFNTKKLQPMGNTGGVMGVMPYIQAGVDVVQGLSMLKGEKNKVRSAKAQSDVSSLQLQAARSKNVDANTMNQQLNIRPEDRQDTGEQFFPIRGVGTNVLQGKNGLSLLNKVGNPGEIQNTYAPNNLYQDLGYEPLNDSEQVKTFWGGGIAQNGGDFMNALGSNAGMDLLGKGSQMLTNNGGMPDAGSMIGGGVGSAAGTLIGGPIGGPIGGAIGKAAGSIIGGAIDRSDNKIKKYNNQRDTNQQAANISQMNWSNSYQENGGSTSDGWISNNWQPQVITKFGDIDVSQIHSIAHQGMDSLRTGGNIRENYTYPQDQFAMDGLQVYKGEAEPVSTNPYLPEGGQSVMFRGPSHDHGGMPIKFGSQGVEVEGGEPAVKLEDGGSSDAALTVFGNLKPSRAHLESVGLGEFTGQKFKGMVDKLTKKTDKLNTLVDKSTNKINDQPINTSFDKIGFDSWKANLLGANMHLKTIADKTKNAAALQQAINDTADEHGIVADDLARGHITKAKFGKTIAQDGSSSNPISDPTDIYSTQGINPGSINYNPIHSGYNVSDWDTQQHYNQNWVPKVNKAFDDPNFGPQLISRLENYSGNDFKDVRSAIAKGKTLPEKIAIAKRLGTDSKVGPYHKVLSQMLTPSANQLRNPPEIIAPEDTWEPGMAPVTETPSPTKRNKFPWMEAINATVPYLRPNNQLDRPDLTPEMMAMGFNQQEPVQARQFQPQLDVPYDVSYQDLLNKNQGDFRASERMIQNNPAFLAQLNAQKYAANQQVLGEQFRANQGEKNQVYNKNRDTLNQAQLQNLGIMDKQYERQTSAKAKTQEQSLNIANSISDKLNKYKEEQQIANLEQQRNNYRFDNNGRAINMNPLAQWNMSGTPSVPARAQGQLAPGYEDTYDISGQRIGTRRASNDNAKNGKKIITRNGSIVRALKTI